MNISPQTGDNGEDNTDEPCGHDNTEISLLIKNSSQEKTDENYGYDNTAISHVGESSLKQQSDDNFCEHNNSVVFCGHDKTKVSDGKGETSKVNTVEHGNHNTNVPHQEEVSDHGKTEDKCYGHDNTSVSPQ